MEKEVFIEIMKDTKFSKGALNVLFDELEESDIEIGEETLLSLDSEWDELTFGETRILFQLNGDVDLIEWLKERTIAHEINGSILFKVF